MKRDNHCLECSNPTLVPLYEDFGTPSTDCIPIADCVPTATQFYQLHADKGVCSTTPTIQFCKNQTSAGCTECIQGYYVDVDTTGDPGSTCKLMHTDFPFCREVTNR